MTNKEKTLIYSYIYNQRQRFVEEVRELQQNIRYRNIDVIDCLELSCAIERLNTFNQASTDILSILNLYEKRKNNESK